MKRIALTDGSGQWFDLDKAEKFEEDTRWNGRNHISLATGSQWDHQVLCRTASKKWVLHNWSQWQGTLPSYCLIEPEQAVQWLIQNNREVPANLNDFERKLEV